MTGNILPVILSGGSGSRLWPLSRSNTPKQFLSLTGEQSFFQKTVQRLSRFQAPIIVANEEHRFLIAEQLRIENADNSKIILEPAQRDTAPAIVLAALEAISTGHKNDVLLVLPADHIIEDEPAFMESVEAGLSLVNDGNIVVFGSTPTSPKSSYGYIEMGQDINGYGHVVTRFIEKPEIKQAENFCEAGNYLWNTGILMCTPTQYMDILEKYDPEITRRCRVAHVERRADNDFIRPGKDAFEASPSLSLTYALVDEKDNIAVVPLMTAWNDIASWNDLYDVLPKNELGNHVHGNVIIENTKNSFVHSENGVLAVMGLDDVVVVQTPDVTLVSSKKKANLVKKVFTNMVIENNKYTSNQNTYSSWGTTKLIHESNNKQTKLLTINPKCTTNNVKYHKRITHLVVSSGSGCLVLNGVKINITAGEACCLPAGSVYNVINMLDKPLEITEISLGDMSESVALTLDDKQEDKLAGFIKSTAKNIELPTN